MTRLKPPSVRIGHRYRAERLKGPYDAIVIGSGMGGLTSAALLSALGWKVAVMEQHYTAGGYTHSYERQGYEWDVGLHYIGEMGAPTIPSRFMDFLSDGQLKWAPMAPEYDRFHIGDKVYEAMAGTQQFRDNLVRHFPAEAQAIDRYMDLLAQAKKAVPFFVTGRLLTPWLRALLQPLLRWKLPKAFSKTTAEVLAELTSNHELMAVLTAQWGDMGLPPKQSSFIIHALIANHYMHGAYYPVGGSWRIAESILPRIRSAGGEVFTYARVQEIIVSEGRARGVLMADGTRIDCDCVISSAGVFNTFERLLPADVARQTGYAQQLKHVRPSVAHIGVYVGLKGSAEELGLPKTNFWIYPSADYEGDTARFLEDRHAPFPVVYISFPSAKDPDFARRHPGRATIEIVAPASYEWFAQWRDSTWGQRGADYEALKAAFGERLMAHLYDKLPQLRGRVDFHEVSTPLSTDWFGAYARGELYGIDHNPQRFQQDWLTPRTRIPGLWLTGQDIMSCGVVGAMMSGVMTASSVAGMRRMWPLLKKIQSARKHQPAAPHAAP
ncbi:MAG: NAD(P)/FAD-dependent oxidoreductase [Burkholderiales bacterium]|nr:NAD(P)/FAD-dependent oxidoreductase [Burkholderiales bacterium]